MNSRLFEDLLSQLNSEIGHLEEQQRVLLRERESIMQRKLEGILECIKEKETLQMQGRILRESRRTLRKRLSEALGSIEETMSLTEVIARTGEPWQSRLIALRQRIEEIVEQVQQLAHGNRYLIRSALGHISQSIGFFSQLQGAFACTYNEAGRMMRENPSPLKLRQQA